MRVGRSLEVKILLIIKNNSNSNNDNDNKNELREIRYYSMVQATFMLSKKERKLFLWLPQHSILFFDGKKLREFGNIYLISWAMKTKINFSSEIIGMWFLFHAMCVVLWMRWICGQTAFLEFLCSFKWIEDFQYWHWKVSVNIYSFLCTAYFIHGRLECTN